MEIKKLQVRLEECKGKLLEQSPDPSKPLDIHVDHYYSFQQMEEETAALYRLHTKVSPRPEALFVIEIDQSIHAVFGEALPMDQVDKMAYDLCSQGASALSLLVGNLSKELIDTAIIIPPQLNKNSFTKLEVK